MDLQGPDDNFLFLGTRIGSLKHLKKTVLNIFRFIKSIQHCEP